jgi:hypothetical protein
MGEWYFMKLNRLRVNCLYRLSAIGAAVLMSMGVGQVWAGDGPVGFEAKLTVRADDVCKFQVSHVGSAEAKVKYVKGGENGEGVASLTGGVSSLVVTATGGTSCVLNHVDLDYSTTAEAVKGTNGAQAVYTEGRLGFFVVGHSLSSLTAQDAHGKDVHPSTYGISGRAGTKGTGGDKLKQASADLASRVLRLIDRSDGDKWLGVVSDGLFLSDRGQGEVNSVLRFNLAALIDRRIDWAPFRPLRLNFSSDAAITEAKIGLTAYAGDGVYSASTLRRDDSAARDGETLEAVATLTVTAS